MLKYVILFLLCIKSFEAMSHHFAAISDDAIFLTIDTEETASEEKLEVEDALEAPKYSIEKSLLDPNSKIHLFKNTLLSYIDFILDSGTPPPESLA